MENLSLGKEKRDFADGGRRATDDKILELPRYNYGKSLAASLLNVDGRVYELSH